MRLSRPILDVLRWACEQRLEACRLPISALPGSPLERARALGLVTVEECGIPPRPLLCATDNGREVYRQRFVDHVPAATTRARFALRGILNAAHAAKLVETVDAAAAMSELWAEATADVLCALPLAMRLHGLCSPFRGEQPDVVVWAHPEAVAVFLGNDRGHPGGVTPGVLVSQNYLDLLEHDAAAYLWLLEHYTPRKMGRAFMLPPTSWRFYVCAKGGASVSTSSFLGATAGLSRQQKDDATLRGILPLGQGWL
jgi:hypothetical protein